jgi:hypothetical protein
LEQALQAVRMDVSGMNSATKQRDSPLRQAIPAVTFAPAVPDSDALDTTGSTEAELEQLIRREKELELEDTPEPQRAGAYAGGSNASDNSAKSESAGGAAGGAWAVDEGAPVAGGGQAPWRQPPTVPSSSADSTEDVHGSPSRAAALAAALGELAGNRSPGAAFSAWAEPQQTAASDDEVSSVVSLMMEEAEAAEQEESHLEESPMPRATVMRTQSQLGRIDNAVSTWADATGTALHGGVSDSIGTLEGHESRRRSAAERALDASAAADREFESAMRY